MILIRNTILVCFFILLNCTTKEVNHKSDELKDNLRFASKTNLPYKTRAHFNREALKILLEDNDDSINRNSLFEVGWTFYKINRWKDLKITTDILLKRSCNTNNICDQGRSYGYYGVYYENINLNDSAFYFYTKALKCFIVIKNDKRTCQTYQDIARIQFYINDYFGSDLSLIKALKIAKKHNLLYNQFCIYSLLGINSSELNDFDKAFLYHFKALELAKKNKLIENKQAKAICLNDIGYNYYKFGHIKKSILFYKAALKEDKFQIETPSFFCRTLDNLARSKIEINKLDELPKLFYLTSNIRDNLNIDIGKNINKLYLSHYYYTVKDTLKAKKFAHEAYNLSKIFHAPKDMLLSLTQLSKVEPENSLTYSQQYIKISDSMQQLERETRNKFAKIAYETEEITNEKEAAVQQKWIFLGVAILVFIVGVLLFVVIRQRMQKNKMQFTQEQQKNNEEIYQLIQSQQTKINEGRQIEKQRIAQDLHDGIMNKLTSTRLNLDILNTRNDKETIEKCLPIINDIQNIEKEIRSIAHDLNKEVFSNTDSFIAIIESLFEKQKSIFKTKAHLEIDKTINWDLIETTKKIHIYRILQEALSNINKHANAQNIVVSIINNDKNILFEIYDDGIGFSLNGKKKGIGLQNIYSRVKAAGGLIEIKSQKAVGTTLIITIPKKSKTKDA